MEVLTTDFPALTALRRHFSGVNSTVFNKTRAVCKDVPLFAVLIMPHINVNSLVCTDSGVLLQKFPTLAALIRPFSGGICPMSNECGAATKGFRTSMHS